MDRLLEDELYFTEHGIRAKCASDAETLVHAATTACARRRTDNRAGLLTKAGEAVEDGGIEVILSLL